MSEKGDDETKDDTERGAWNEAREQERKEHGVEGQRKNRQLGVSDSGCMHQKQSNRKRYFSRQNVHEARLALYCQDLCICRETVSQLLDTRQSGLSSNLPDKLQVQRQPLLSKALVQRNKTMSIMHNTQCTMHTYGNGYGMSATNSACSKEWRAALSAVQRELSCGSHTNEMIFSGSRAQL